MSSDSPPNLDIFKAYSLFSDQITSLTHQYGGQAVNYAERLAQATAIVSVSQWAIFILFTIAFWFIPIDRSRLWREDNVVPSFMWFIKRLLIIGIFIWTLNMSWSFIGLFAPDIYMGHLALDALSPPR